MKKGMVKLLNYVLRSAGITCITTRDGNKACREKQLLLKLANLPCNPSSVECEDYASCIVFSRDRACQLHALLSSLRDHVEEGLELYVIYRATNDRHKKAYEEVIELFNGRHIEWREEDNFRSDLLTVMGGIATRSVFFLVDDIVFIRPVSLKALSVFNLREYVPSLRLGEHVNYCYTEQQPMKVPELVEADAGNAHLVSWEWLQGDYDWGYPLSVDGHVFLTDEIRLLLENVEFTAPNSLEKAMQVLRELYRMRSGICYRESRIVNIPMNRVQTENDNLYGEVSVEELLERWEAGYRIDVDKLYNVKPESAHQELPVSFVLR